MYLLEEIFRKPNISSFKKPILQENHAFLRQKICLMALIESVFKRDADNRTMSFQNIAEETRLPLDEVEHLVMKALRYCYKISLYVINVIFLTILFIIMQPQIDPWLIGSS